MYKKTLLFILFAVINIVVSVGQIPDGYYDNATGLSGTELKLSLREIITNGFIGKSYGDSRDILDETDQDLENPANLILLYLGTSVSGTWDSGVTWNREHVWPQSLMGVSVSNSTISMGSDLHNLKPADPDENGFRGNKYFDEVATSSTYTPRDEVKGDIARVLFYMTTRYSNLELVNTNPNTYEMAKLDVLLAWHKQDPVDDFERNRNEVIYTYQHNRNPFIDHPEYVAQIWETSAVNETLASKIQVFPNPTTDQLHIGGNTADASYKVVNILGKVVKEGSLDENTISVSDLPKGKYILMLLTQQTVQTTSFVKINP